jgi:phosphatidylserine/phosphatidylglycerophosphate/cardiolipin synthase-like enzyme
VAAVCFALIVCSSFTYTFSQTSPHPDEIIFLEIAESVPVETDLGLPETRPTFAVWRSMFESARDSILMEFFYISPKKGELLDTLLHLLRKKAGQGVRVKILVDGRMAETYPKALEDLDRVAGIEVRRISVFNQMGGVMHAKYFIIDDREVFIGSQNFDWRALKHIHEAGVRIANRQLALQTARLFHIDWHLASAADTANLAQFLSSWPFDFRPLNRKHRLFYRTAQDTVWIYPAYSPVWCLPPEFEWDETVLLHLLNNAQEHVHIQLLTYSPADEQDYYSKLDGTLRALQTKGVSIRILVSNWNADERRWPYLLSLDLLPNVEIRYSSLPPWSGGFIPYARVEHCKYMVVDGKWVWLGTSNWAKDYFYHSRNLSLIFQGASFAATLQRIFEKSWESPYAHKADPCRQPEPPRIR